jgi:hypothetical protein
MRSYLSFRHHTPGRNCRKVRMENAYLSKNEIKLAQTLSCNDGADYDIAYSYISIVQTARREKIRHTSFGSEHVC